MRSIQKGANTVLKAKHQWISKEDYLALIQDETVAKLFQAFERHIVNQSDWDAVWAWHNFRSLWEGAQDVLDQREIFDQCWNMQLNMLSTFGK